MSGNAAKKLPLRRTSFTEYPMPSDAKLKSHAGWLDFVAEYTAIAVDSEDAVRAVIHAELKQPNAIIAAFDEQYGRWRRMATPPMPLPTAPKVPARTEAKAPKEDYEGPKNLAKSKHTQEAAGAQTPEDSFRTGQGRYPQPPAGTQSGKAASVPATVKVKVVIWCLIRGTIGQVAETTMPFDMIVGLERNCPTPSQRAEMVSVRPATFMDFRGVAINDDLTYKDDDGKVAPYRYGCNVTEELWLCFVTFMTFSKCPHGVKCRYRHAKLELQEVFKIATTAEGRKWLYEVYVVRWDKEEVQGRRRVSPPAVREHPFPHAVVKDVAESEVLGQTVLGMVFC